MDKAYDFVDMLIVVAWNAIIILGTAYLVFWQGHSGWWFLLATVLTWGTDRMALARLAAGKD